MARIEGARFGHVNVTSADWRRLAAFYTDLFGCELVPPERDISGEHLDRATGIAGAHLTGAHLRLPGHGPEGPTIEIFQYDEVEAGRPPKVDRGGGGHAGVPGPAGS